MSNATLGKSDRSELSFKDWIRKQVEAEPYWFHKIRLWEDLYTPGWSEPEVEKLPYFGLPEDMTGLRVLDIGCAEGFFSFEAERRGAAEVVGIDSFPDSIRRFNIVRNARGSKVMAYLCNVYDLAAKTFGTFDLVMYYGVLYHLRHPLLALERILDVCRGTMLLQTACSADVPGLEGQPMAQFHPFGIDSGPDAEGRPLRDPTVFWLPNRACVRAMVAHAGFQQIETLSESEKVSIVVRAVSPLQEKGVAPDQQKAPWS